MASIAKNYATIGLESPQVDEPATASFIRRLGILEDNLRQVEVDLDAFLSRALGHPNALIPASGGMPEASGALHETSARITQCLERATRIQDLVSQLAKV